MEKKEIIETGYLTLVVLALILFILDKFTLINVMNTPFGLFISLVFGIGIILYTIKEIIKGRVLVIGGVYLNKKNPISFYTLVFFRLLVGIFLIVYPIRQFF